MPTHWHGSWDTTQPRTRTRPAAEHRTGDPQPANEPPHRHTDHAAHTDHTDHAGRDPLVILLARPARDRTPAAMVWRLLTYDRHTRCPVAEIAQRWEPAGPAAGLRPGQDITVPDRILAWLRATLDGEATITGPAHDYAGPASWRIQPAPSGAAGAAGTEVWS